MLESKECLNKKHAVEADIHLYKKYSMHLNSICESVSRSGDGKSLDVLLIS